jgi:hypothetical protein
MIRRLLQVIVLCAVHIDHAVKLFHVQVGRAVPAGLYAVPD